MQCASCVAVQALLACPAWCKQSAPSGAISLDTLAVLCAPLVLALIMLVREGAGGANSSGSIAVRLHAAAALGALPNRQVAGGCTVDAALVVLTALDGLVGSGGGAGSSQNGSSGGLDEWAGMPGQRALDMQVASGGGACDRAALHQQLCSTLVHLLGLVSEADVQRQPEALTRRLPVLLRALEAAAYERLHDVLPAQALQEADTHPPQSKVLAALPDDLTLSSPDGGNISAQSRTVDWLQLGVSRCHDLRAALSMLRPLVAPSPSAPAPAPAHVPATAVNAARARLAHLLLCNQ